MAGLICVLMTMSYGQNMKNGKKGNLHTQCSEQNEIWLHTKDWGKQDHTQNTKAVELPHNKQNKKPIGEHRWSGRMRHSWVLTRQLLWCPLMVCSMKKNMTYGRCHLSYYMHNIIMFFLIFQFIIRTIGMKFIKVLL